jgi:hypothetical protein
MMHMLNAFAQDACTKHIWHALMVLNRRKVAQISDSIQAYVNHYQIFSNHQAKRAPAVRLI